MYSVKISLLYGFNNVCKYISQQIFMYICVHFNSPLLHCYMYHNIETLSCVNYIEPQREKNDLGVSDQVRHKSACTDTEAG